MWCFKTQSHITLDYWLSIQSLCDDFPRLQSGMFHNLNTFTIWEAKWNVIQVEIETAFCLLKQKSLYTAPIVTTTSCSGKFSPNLRNKIMSLIFSPPQSRQLVIGTKTVKLVCCMDLSNKWVIIANYNAML